MATAPCTPLDSAYRPAMSSCPVIPASPEIVVQPSSYPTSPRAHQSAQPIVDNVAPNAVQYRRTDVHSTTLPVDFATPTTRERAPEVDSEPSAPLRPAPTTPLATIDRAPAIQPREEPQTHTLEGISSILDRSVRTTIPLPKPEKPPDYCTGRPPDVQDTTIGQCQ